MTKHEPTYFMRVPFYTLGYLVTEENMEDVSRWCRGHIIDNDGDRFIRVPVNRPSHSKHTEARVGTWVLMSILHNEPNFKVYDENWLFKDFCIVPDKIFNDVNGLYEISDLGNEEPLPPHHPSHDNRIVTNVRALPSLGVNKVNWRSATP